MASCSAILRIDKSVIAIQGSERYHRGNKYLFPADLYAVDALLPADRRSNTTST